MTPASQRSSAAHRTGAPELPEDPVAVVAMAGGQAAIVSATTIVVSAANYGFSLLVVYLVLPAEYVQYAAIQSLLLVLGSGGMAAIPWAIARHVTMDRSTRAAQEALGFGLLAASAQGVAFAVVAFAVVAPVSGAPLGFASSVAAFLISLVAAPLGLLQGDQRLGRMSALRVIEAVVRLGLSILLLLTVSASALSPVLGFAAGSLVLFVMALVTCRRGLPPLLGAGTVMRPLLRTSMSLGAVQFALAALGVLDTVTVAFTALGTDDASAYQLAALLGRVPLFLGSAVALSYFQALARAGSDAEVRTVLGGATRSLLITAVPVAALVATCPSVVLDLLTDGRSAAVGALLPATAVLGLSVAVTTVLATAHQAQGRYRAVLWLVLPVAAAQPFVLVAAGHGGSAQSYAIAGAVVGLLSVISVGSGVRQWRPWNSIRRPDALRIVGVGLLALVGAVVPWAWCAAVASLPVVLMGSRPSRARMTRASGRKS